MEERVNEENEVEELIKSKSNLSKMNFFKRNFGRKIKKGSLRGSVISWMRMTFGVGIFALPYCFSQFGILTGVILIIFAVIYSYWSCKDILIISEISNKNDLFEIVKFYLGKKYAEVYKISLFLDIGSNYFLYPLITFGIFTKITDKYFNFVKDEKGNVLDYNSHNFFIRFIFFAIIFLLSFPLLLKRRIDNMNFISTIFLVNIIYFFIVILIQTGYFVKNHKGDSNYEYEIFSVPANFNFISSFCSIILSFYIQPFIFQIKRELNNPTKKRIFKVSKISLLFELIIFLIIGIAGYLSVGKAASDLIILRKPYEGLNDIVMNIGLYVFILINTIGIPIYNPSLRNLIMESYNLKDNKKNYILVSLLPYFIGLTIAVFYPKIVQIFGLLGAIFCNINGFLSIFAIKIMLKIRNKSKKDLDFFITLFCLFFSIFIFISYIGFSIIGSFYS